MARVDGSETLGLPRERVWALLNDPQALGAAIPGCHGLEREAGSEHSYRTAIAVAIGAVKGVYEGTVEPLHSLEVEWRDRVGGGVSATGEGSAGDHRESGVAGGRRRSARWIPALWSGRRDSRANHDVRKPFAT